MPSAAAMIQRRNSAPAAIDYVDSRVIGQSGSAVITVDTPTHVVGDLLVFFLYSNNHTRTVSAGPDGATLAISETAAVAGLRVWTKIASGIEPSTFTVTMNASDHMVLACLSYSGASGVAGAYAVATGTSNPSTTGTFTPGSSGVLLSFFTSDNNPAPTVATPPSGPVARISSIANSRACVGYELDPSGSGATTAQTLTWSGSPLSLCNIVFQVI